MLVEFNQNTVESADAIWIELCCEPYSDLDWSQELLRAQATEKKIVWYFRLGLEKPLFPIEDEFRFNSLSLALKKFTTDVWPQFTEKTLAMSLYKGAAVDFAIYFQMLAHKLPDEVPIWLLFDLDPSLPSSSALQLISKEGFEHFKIAIRGKNLPLEGYRWDEKSIYMNLIDTTTGAVFPTLDYHLFDPLLERGPLKVVFESFLADQWDGLDTLLVLSNSLTPQGRRMLQGFIAAGGEVVYC